MLNKFFFFQIVYEEKKTFYNNYFEIGKWDKYNIFNDLGKKNEIHAKN